ncbi:MAG: A/G-specific adenine glycosylase [Gammaproteobacteria bacterium]|nr:A/G-specific adenine glycosylase [Pseudomonadales bacterium]MCP5347355.1 A/G-specific adenine glycosylase [Pseudomonadales bacterium]
MADFADKLLGWYDRHGRQDLPWQQDPTPYRVWVSEIMLQQTQVGTVIPYYQRFMATFPTVGKLAAADLDQVLHLWTGLGYYARARNLHHTARLLVSDHGGEFPAAVDTLCELPGIGLSTAGAIVALAHGRRATILDGNVKRVLTRCFAVAGWPEQSSVRRALWELAERLTPERRVGAYTQAIMDLGATVCTRSKPACEACPIATRCQARRAGEIALYPGRKPARTLPVKATFMHLLHNAQNQVLLEKRPASGIWGGLWSLPETVDKGPLPSPGGNLLQTEAPDLWPTLRHTFSHYHLDITPVHHKVVSEAAGIMESDRWLWYPLNQPAEVGLAAPVKKLLQQLESRNGNSR